jgi:hypothetical protein
MHHNKTKSKMNPAIKQIKDLQDRQIELLKEYQQAKQAEAIRAQYGFYYHVIQSPDRGQFFLVRDGQGIIRSGAAGEIRSYFNLRRTSVEQIIGYELIFDKDIVNQQKNKLI